MTKKIALPVFIAFAALNVWAFATSGISGFIDFLAHPTPWSIVLGVDLIIALTMVCSWMVVDAREKGSSALGYVITTVALGSIGSLLYLLRRRA